MNFKRNVILFLGLLVILAFSMQESIKKIKICRFRNDGELSAPFPDSLKKYFSKEEIEDFENGHKEFWDVNFRRVYYITYYNLDKGMKYIYSEGYWFLDSPIGRVVYYYPNGKISSETNYVIFSDSTGKGVDVEIFNKNCATNRSAYSILAHGQFKTYSDSGKLLKVEEYNKGKLIKTTTY